MSKEFIILSYSNKFIKFLKFIKLKDVENKI